MAFEIALKVDVDTFVGARDGIPRLREAFRMLGVPAAFFVTMGPDHSGRAIFRVFTQKGFLTKQLRNKATTTYGWRTVLSGTLLPGRLVGAQFGPLLIGLNADGHDVGPHGWDHIAWHDKLRRMDHAATLAHFQKAFEAVAKALGKKPEGSAAPGWQCTAHSLAVMDELGIRWHSDTRGIGPFVPSVRGREFLGIEIPTTLPTLDEVLGTPEVEREGPVNFFLARTHREKLNVFTMHTETEGLGHLDFLIDLIRGWKAQGARFVKLSDIADRLIPQRGDLPRHEVVFGELPGRAGKVAIQGLSVLRVEPNR